VPPDWQANAHGALQSAVEAYLSGNTRVAEVEMTRARASLVRESALAEVMQRTGADHLLAAGDGALDAGFLLMADRAIRPPHGELAETGWHAANVDVSSAIGVLAGEEIVRWLADQVDLAGQDVSVTADETA
jgi:hypothetical protein